MDFKKAIYATYPLVPTIVVVKGKEKLNALSVAWHSWLSFEPPLYMVAIGHTRYSYPLIKETGEFTANFLPLEKAHLYTLVGRTSGKDVDKFKEYSIETENFRGFGTPYLKDAVAAYACKVQKEFPTGDHSIFVARVLDFYMDSSAFMEDGFPVIENYSPSVYLGKNRYLSLKGFSIVHIGLEEALKKLSRY